MRRSSCLLALALCGSGGCGGDSSVDPDTSSDTGALCGDLECTDGLRLSLVAQAGTFAAASYVVTLGAPGLGTQCEFVVADDMLTCGGETSCVPSTTCDSTFGAEFVLTPPPAHGLFFVPVVGSVQVVVERGGTVVVDDLLEPSYVEVAPNGTDCEPVCQLAEAQVLVP